MISTTINKQIAEALKAHDEIRLSTLRLLSSAFNYEKIAKQHELSVEEELNVVRREAKKRKEAIDAYEKAGAKDRADKEKQELAILEKYLPAQMPDEAISKIVDEVVGSIGNPSIAEMGKVMGVVMAKVGSQADGGRVSQIVKNKLAGGK